MTSEKFVLCRGGKSTENLYSSTSTVTLHKFYSSTSKSTGVKKYLSKSTKYSSHKLLRVFITFEPIDVLLHR